MRYDVVIVGSINVDLMLTVERHPHPGETLRGGSGAHLAGGKGATQAVAAARTGARTAMVGAVGSDATADTALEHLRGADVDLSSVRTVPGPTGLAVVTLAADGENTIVVVPGANATVTPDVVREAAAVIRDAAVCVVQAEIPLPSVEEAVRVAHDAGVRVVLNVAPAARLPWATLRAADPLVVQPARGLDPPRRPSRRTGGRVTGRRRGGGRAGAARRRRPVSRRHRGRFRVGRPRPLGDARDPGPSGDGGRHHRGG